MNRYNGFRDTGFLAMDCAPWLDDQFWKIRLNIYHENYSEALPEAGRFHFNYLPVPKGNGVEVDRTVTKGAMSLSIKRIYRSKTGEYRFRVEGFRSDILEGTHLVVQDVRDDKGRISLPDRPKSRLIESGNWGGGQHWTDLRNPLPARGRMVASHRVPGTGGNCGIRGETEVGRANQ